MDYIYLLKEREFIKKGEDIFKIGRSSQFNDKKNQIIPKRKYGIINDIL